MSERWSHFVIIGFVIVFALSFQESLSAESDIPSSLADSDIAAFMDVITGESKIGQLTFKGTRFDHIRNQIIEPETHVPTRLQAVLSQQSSYVKHLKEGALVWENGVIKNRDTIQILACAATLKDVRRLELTPQVEEEIVNYWSGIVNTVHLPRIRKDLGRKAGKPQESPPLELLILEGQEFKVGKTIEVKAALRNESQESITLVQPALDWTLAIRYGSDAEDLEALGMKGLVSRIPPATSVIRPGEEFVFTIVLPPTLYGLPGEPGDYEFQMIYARSKEDFFGKKVWTGEIRSLPVAVRFVSK